MLSRKIKALAALFVALSACNAYADKISELKPGYYAFKSFTLYSTKDPKKNFKLTAKTPGFIRKGDVVSAANNSKTDLMLREVQFPLAIAATDIVVHFYDNIAMSAVVTPTAAWLWQAQGTSHRRTRFEGHAVKIDGTKVVLIEASREVTVEVTYESQPIQPSLFDRPEAQIHIDKNTKVGHIDNQSARFPILEFDRSASMTKVSPFSISEEWRGLRNDYVRELHEIGLAIKGRATKLNLNDQSIVEHNITWTIDLMKWRNRSNGVSQDRMLAALEMYRQILEAHKNQLEANLKLEANKERKANTNLFLNEIKIKLNMVEQATMFIMNNRIPYEPGPWQVIQ